ncbi:MAG: septation ring formation regulator EzrA [Pelagibacteraceae bacterium]|nr:septation ring formation regulator EzrA [Pelagibacteraceae bacterium]PHX88621.1 MAG: septation ring formation regulator EzrA [Pelagibacteraceae bacterium]
MFNIIKKNYFVLLSTFLILYFIFNLLSGERGFFSYIEKKNILQTLKKEELLITNKIKDFDFKNSLLDTNLDLDYIESLIRERFLFGKKNETIYIIKNDKD